MRVDRAEEPYVILTEYNGNPYIKKGLLYEVVN